MEKNQSRSTCWLEVQWLKQEQVQPLDNNPRRKKEKDRTMKTQIEEQLIGREGLDLKYKRPGATAHTF